MISKTYIKSILAFVLFTYVIQFLFYYNGFYNQVWKTSEHYFFFFVQIISFIFFSLIFYYKNPISILFFCFNFFTKYIAIGFIKYRKPIILICVLLSIYFALFNLNAYRYSSERLSDNANIFLLLIVFLKSAIYSYVFINFDLKQRMGDDEFLSLGEKFGVVVVQILSLTGLTSGLMLVVSIYFLFFYSNRNKINYKKILHIVLIIFFLILSFIFSYAIKWESNFSETIAVIKGMNIKSYFDYLISRLSGSYYGVMIYSDLDLDYSGNFKNFLITFENILFRFDSLVGGVFDLSKPSVNSLNRLHYTYINNTVTDDRSGASPGILASFLYQFGGLWGSVLASSYASYIFKLSFFNNKDFSFMKFFLLIMFFQGVFKAPFQALLIFDTNFLSLIIFLYYNSLFSRLTINDNPKMIKQSLGIIKTF